MDRPRTQLLPKRDNQCKHWRQHDRLKLSFEPARVVCLSLKSLRKRERKQSADHMNQALTESDAIHASTVASSTPRVASCSRWSDHFFDRNN